MSSKSRSAIRSSQSTNHIDNGSTGNIEFGLHPITNKPSASRLFLYGVDPKNVNMRCCQKKKTSLPMTFAAGSHRPSYPGMRLFA